MTDRTISNVTSHDVPGKEARARERLLTTIVMDYDCFKAAICIDAFAVEYISVLLCGSLTYSREMTETLSWCMNDDVATSLCVLRDAKDLGLQLNLMQLKEGDAVTDWSTPASWSLRQMKDDTWSLFSAVAAMTLPKPRPYRAYHVAAFIILTAISWHHWPRTGTGNWWTQL